MVSDPTLFLENLSLCYFENNCILKLKKSNLKNPRSFANTFEFVDDLCGINYSSFLVNNC